MMVESSPILNNSVIQSFLGAFEHSLFSMTITDADPSVTGHRFLFVNQPFLNQTGYELSELVGKSPRILQGEKTDKQLLSQLKKTIYAGETFIGQTINYRKDGSEYIVRWSINPIRDEHGGIIAFLSCQMEVSQQIKDHQIAHVLSEALNQTSDAVLITDLFGKIIFSNKALSNLTGYSNDELLNEHSRIFRSGEMEATFYQELWSNLLQNKPFDGVFLNRHKNGRLYYDHKSISPILDDQHKPMYYLAISRDTTETIEKTKQLSDIAFYDALTGLFNRFKFNELLDEYYQQFEQTGQAFSLMIADVDNFKQINDNYGHDIGDIVLTRVAHCLQSSQIDGVVARWGGEEFALLFNKDELSKVIEFSETLVQAVSEIDLTDIGLKNITISAGVATMKADMTLSQLFNLADSSLYQAKHDGKNCVRSLNLSN